MQKTVVINVVGLTSSLINENTPFLKQWVAKGELCKIKPMLPSVTCSVQSTYLTGQWPSIHGIVANGWYFQDLCEIKFWHQSNKLVSAPKIWDTLKKQDPSFTCANMFWWYNMYSTVDYSVTPRPIYAADGNKIQDCYTYPINLRDELQKKLGKFPLFNFWGPNTSIKSSKWIAESSKVVEYKYNPTLTLIYLPHLDYSLQKSNSESLETKTSLKEIDNVCEDLISFYEKKNANVIILSEYGIEHVDNVVYINQILRKEGYLKIREENGGELLDAGASLAFAVCDHQIAHIYIQDKTLISKIFKLLNEINGISLIIGENEKKEYNISHKRSGDLVVIADEGSWFSYYYWLDKKKAPDFAKTVEIHKKPGYDPAELFIDPNIKWAKFRIFLTLLKKKLGFRYLMKYIPLNDTIVKGSHGRINTNPKNYPIIVTQKKHLLRSNLIEATEVFSILLEHIKMTKN